MSEPTKGQIDTTKKVGNLPETQESLKLRVPEIKGDVAHVRFGFGMTINLGNYESARLDVAVTYPCEATPEAVEDTFRRVKHWVDQKMEQEITELKGQSGK